MPCHTLALPRPALTPIASAAVAATFLRLSSLQLTSGHGPDCEADEWAHGLQALLVGPGPAGGSAPLLPSLSTLELVLSAPLPHPACAALSSARLTELRLHLPCLSPSSRAGAVGSSSLAAFLAPLQGLSRLAALHLDCGARWGGGGATPAGPGAAVGLPLDPSLLPLAGLTRLELLSIRGGGGAGGSGTALDLAAAFGAAARLRHLSLPDSRVGLVGAGGALAALTCLEVGCLAAPPSSLEDPSPGPGLGLDPDPGPVPGPQPATSASAPEGRGGEAWALPVSLRRLVLRYCRQSHEALAALAPPPAALEEVATVGGGGGVPADGSLALELTAAAHTTPASEVLPSAVAALSQTCGLLAGRLRPVADGTSGSCSAAGGGDNGGSGSGSGGGGGALRLGFRHRGVWLRPPPAAGGLAAAALPGGGGSWLGLLGPVGLRSLELDGVWLGGGEVRALAEKLQTLEAPGSASLGTVLADQGSYGIGSYATIRWAVAGRDAAGRDSDPADLGPGPAGHHMGPDPGPGGPRAAPQPRQPADPGPDTAGCSSIGSDGNPSVAAAGEPSEGGAAAAGAAEEVKDQLSDRVLSGAGLRALRSLRALRQLEWLPWGCEPLGEREVAALAALPRLPLVTLRGASGHGVAPRGPGGAAGCAAAVRPRRYRMERPGGVREDRGGGVRRR
ncbi:hypothetical protein HYH03_007628 [Edaphochlamys debaryana]|uniref:Uncharacterized protein n=1 Tax=Edaphochlamys debaryana TaxID=47281 RepID=A0A836C0B0_9CHLO|nr:hypothetical protein HYH03_007628 [Edaphochlamys debaryana]|eukprot:KAG2494274.1 hypothetical protein HYH03_007628 [Edaphochlamys debaryana]